MTREEAKIEVDRLVPQLMDRFGGAVSNPTFNWRGDVMEFSGRAAIFNIEGTLHVTDTQMILEVDGIPFFGRERTRAEIEHWFDESWSGASLGDLETDAK